MQAAALAAMLTCASAAARAGGSEASGGRNEEELGGLGAGATAGTAARGAFLPFSQGASVEAQRAYAVGFGGYDGARRSGAFEAAAELRLWGPIALRGGAVYAGGTRTVRPSFGARVQLLSEGRHGADGAVGVFYRPEGLTEPEGEIESVLSLGRHLGATYLLANLLYGQDPEGNERDGEVRMAALRPVAARLLVGFDSRLRLDLGSQAAKLDQHGEARLDAVAGPAATVVVGPIALLLQGGASAVRLRETTSYGVSFMAGAGGAF
jgi:hypothetical protein